MASQDRKKIMSDIYHPAKAMNLGKSGQVFIEEKLLGQRTKKELSFNIVSQHLEARHFKVEQAILADRDEAERIIDKVERNAAKARETEIRHFVIVILSLCFVLTLGILLIVPITFELTDSRIFMSYSIAIFALIGVLVTAMMRLVPTKPRGDTKEP